ncbi:hypothetical protein J437_LFUL003702, partial [Ladona fulva]
MLSVSSRMTEQTRDRLGQRPCHSSSGEAVCPAMTRGIDHIRDPRLNKMSSSKTSTYQRGGKSNTYEKSDEITPL